jgi:hypothetical protein
MSLFDDIPEREPLPDQGGGRGPGLSGEEIPKVKASEIVGDDIAVTGFLILPNGFKESESDPDEYALVEIIDTEDNNFLFSTMSNALLKTLEARFDRGEIPFKTSVELRKSKNNRDYYVFA